MAPGWLADRLVRLSDRLVRLADGLVRLAIPAAGAFPTSSVACPTSSSVDVDTTLPRPLDFRPARKSHALV